MTTNILSFSDIDEMNAALEASTTRIANMLNELLAPTPNLPVWALDQGEGLTPFKTQYGQMMVGERDDVIQDILTHFELSELPQHWELKQY